MGGPPAKRCGPRCFIQLSRHRLSLARLSSEKKEGNAQALEQTRKTRIQGDTPGGVVLSMSRLSSLPFTSSCPAGRLCAHHTPHRTWPHSMRQLAQRTMTHRPPRRDTSLDACDLSQCHWYLGPRDDGETRGWRIVAACHRLAASLS